MILKKAITREFIRRAPAIAAGLDSIDRPIRSTHIYMAARARAHALYDNCAASMPGRGSGDSGPAGSGGAIRSVIYVMLCLGKT